jgi:nicotinamidase-related amidase
MPLSKLDTTTALIVIDLQKVILNLPTVHPLDDVINRAAALADAFRRRRLPVVLVNADGRAAGRTEQTSKLRDLPAGWTDLLPELKQQPNDHFVTKQTWGAFTNTDLHRYLQKQGATEVVIIGVATSIGVESTARQAYELGFNVALAIDAMTDMNADAHLNSVTRIFPRLGEVGTTREIINLLENPSEMKGV